MGDITNLSWQIIIPDDSDWLVVNPMSGTGNTKINVDIVDSKTGSTSTTAVISAVCTSCSEYLEPFTLEIIRCIMCDCDDLVVERIFPCGCEDLVIEPIQCSCDNISLNVESLSFGYNEQTSKGVVVTDTCALPVEYIPVPNKNFIHVTMTQGGFNVSVDPNTSNTPRDGKVEVKFNGITCKTVNINQDGKPCDCNNLTLTQK